MLSRRNSHAGVRWALVVCLCALVPLFGAYSSARAQQNSTSNDVIPSIEEQTAGLEKLDGYFPLYWDGDSGTLWMEINRFDTEILNLGGLSAGLGSNDVGLDRGQGGGSRIVSFERVGRKVLMIQPNYRFRAVSDNPDEVRAVTDAFARSTLWGFTVAAETDDRVLVDMTDYLLRDTHNAIRRLRRSGAYKVDKSRSVVYRPMTMNFPLNTEIEVMITYSSESSIGGGVRYESAGAVAANGTAVSLRVHHSFVALPDDNYTPRPYDPRAGYGAVTYTDYATPLGEPMVKRFIRRHRLEKKNPGAPMSDPVEPIIYYLDRGTPEPIRSALLDGAGWWNQAFEAAGYRNAFRVEMLPEDVSSHDIRYNVINWVHRSTRGWSYGGSVTDPRTGEIIKGVVVLGSLRVRQDYMIAEGLLSPYETGTETSEGISQWALARIRQLGAHEVGHTIGLGHNYYDSRQGRISVMDYPHPLVTLNNDGSFDYSDVYDVGIGAWDKVTVTYGYQDFPDGTDEAPLLEKLLDDAWQDDVLYLSNQDMSANPKVDQWSNGNEPAEELNRMMEVRRAALDRFGVRAIKTGMPMATMEEVLVPLYMHHRFQVTATASALGGLHYIYAMRGDGRVPVRPVSPSEQNDAISALVATLAPQELEIPTVVLENLPPRPPGYRRTREMFPRYTGLMFDAISPATVAADHTVAEMLTFDRAARLVEQRALDASQPGLHGVITSLIRGSFDVETSNGYHAEISRAVERVVVDRLISLASGASMPQVRAIASLHLDQLTDRLVVSDGDISEDAHRASLARRITQHFEGDSNEAAEPSILIAPPGAPIGQPALNWLGNLEPACSYLDW
jgi:hypothetical protein